MAGENGHAVDSLKRFIEQNYSNLSFTYIVRLLRLTGGEAQHFDALFEKLRIHPYLSLAFPASDVQKLIESDDTYELVVNFMGLYGTGSPLPTFYTEELLDEKQNGRSALESFYNIFNSRQYALYFSAWLKHKLNLRIVEDGDEDALRIYQSFIGDSDGRMAEEFSYLDGYRLLRYAPMLIHKTRPADGLKVLLQDLLGVRVRINQAVESVERIPQEQCNRLGSANTTLGEDLHLGGSILDASSRFSVVLEALDAGTLHGLLPDSPGYGLMEEAVSVYLNEHLRWNVEYELQDESGGALLGGDQWSRLGWNTWLGGGGRGVQL